MAKTKSRRDRERKRVSARRRVEEHQSGSGSSCVRIPEGLNFFKVDKPGIRLIDVMPYVVKSSKYADEGDPYWEKTYWAHRSIGPNQEMVVCPAKTFGEPCPICEHRAKLSNDPNADEDVIKDLAPKERQLFLVRDLKDPDRGLQLWDISFHLFGRLLDERIRSADDDEIDLWDGFANLEDGSSLRCSFTEESFAGRNFQKCVAIDIKPRKVQYDESDLEEHPCLDDLLVIKSYKELKKLFLQIEAANGQDDDDEEEEHFAHPSRSRKSAKAKVEEEEEDDDDDWEDEDEPKTKKRGRVQDEEDEDEDEDEPPKKKSSRKPPSKKPAKSLAKDEEEDDELDEEEEETRKPNRRSKSSKATVASKKGSKKDDDDWDDDWDDE